MEGLEQAYRHGPALWRQDVAEDDQCSYLNQSLIKIKEHDIRRLLGFNSKQNPESTYSAS
jgi:hypothetical protein